MITEPGVRAHYLAHEREKERRKRRLNSVRLAQLTDECMKAQEEHAAIWRETQVRMSDEKRDEINEKIRRRIDRRLRG